MANKRLIISDIPTPWREPVFERVYRSLYGEVEVVYFNKNEKRRLWKFNHGSYPKIILRSIRIRMGGGERFFNPGIVPFLLCHRPRTALITASLKDPTAWLALFVCRTLGTKIALLCDTWVGRDQGINIAQRFARYFAYNYFARAYVGASKKTLEMFKYYNRSLTQEKLFLSHLVADNEYFNERLRANKSRRKYDLMFSGRISPEKNPVFFARVCAKVKSIKGSCRVLIIGEGQNEIKEFMRLVFENHGVEHEYAGFIEHARLPDFYSQARLLLMPTSGDCWGVVINEAMLAGTPVVTTAMTAASGELVIHEENGLVLPLDETIWATKIIELLENKEKWERYSSNAQRKVKEFSFDRAAAGIIAAFRYLEN
jgi:glycosyltransferase involved in cell wall biosynthesis